jgi:hypothetical protein
MFQDVTTWSKFGEKLSDVGLAIFGDKEIPITNKGATDPTVMVIALLARSISNFKGALAMARAGMVVEARTLMRCIFENGFCVGGLVTQGDEFVKDMFHDELTSRKLRGKIVLDTPMANREFEEWLRSRIEQMNEKYPQTKFLTPKQASQKSPLAAGYLLYSQLSSDAAHPSMSALSRYIARHTEDGEVVRGIDISPPPKETEIAQTIDLGCHAFIGVIVGANQMLGGTAANDQINAIVGEYQALAGIVNSSTESGPQTPIMQK